ncbi:PQQ-dependent sugar dehydrogenase [Paraglaciecola sp.]|uniref:PQQ-dependent sugar dehydrogenase n=1 Tax=Paraglaciecola sp. TaxID=1920173 RepID=UPI0030F3E3B5
MVVSNIRNITIIITGALALFACGSGGSDSPSTPTNNNPVFSSPNMLDVAENTGDAFYTATATDADGDVLSFSISGGADSALFVLDVASGSLSFINPPDFEMPVDVGGDNIFNVTLSVSDGQGGQANLAVTITVTDEQQTAQVRLVGQGFNQPLYATALLDGSGRMLIAEKGGQVRVLSPDTAIIAAIDFLDVSGSISTQSERGLLGIALAPDFSTSGQIYINVTNISGDTEIRGYKTFPDSLDRIDPATENVILTINQPASNHNGGWLGFDNNGLLVIPTGDGGGSGDPDDFAQDPHSLLGKVLRIDVTHDDFPADDARNYAIPPGNTFTDEADGLPEIYALGLRNPFRASFDPSNGDLLIGDVGQNAIEEIDRLPMNDSSYNFGWAVREGTAQYKGADDVRFTPPVAEYTQGNGATQGHSVTGGYVYNGPVETLQGAYIFADYVSSNIWSLPASDLLIGETIPHNQFTVLTTLFTPDTAWIDKIVSFGLDENRNLYIVSLSGNVFRLEARN